MRFNNFINQKQPLFNEYIYMIYRARAEQDSLQNIFNKYKTNQLIIFCGSFFWDICHFWLYDGNSQQGSRKEKGEKSEGGGTVAIKTKAKALIAR